MEVNLDQTALRFGASSLQDLYRQWGFITRTRLAPAVARCYQKRVNEVIFRYSLVQLAQITPMVCQDLPRHYAEDRGLKSTTVAAYVGAFRSFVNYLLQVHALEADPFQGVMMPRMADPEVTWLRPAQVQRVLQLARIYGGYFPIKLALYTGMRRMELAHSRAEDINWNDHLLQIRAENTKSKRGRVVPIPDPLFDDLVVLDRREGYLLGEGAKSLGPRRMSRLLEPVKEFMPEITGWHIFRHTYVSLLLQNGVSLVKVSKWVGHRKYETTLKYYANLATDHYDEDCNRMGSFEGKTV